MSRQAAHDLALREGHPFVQNGREGRVVKLTSTELDVFVEVEVDGPPALTGVPGEPPGADDA